MNAIKTKQNPYPDTSSKFYPIFYGFPKSKNIQWLLWHHHVFSKALIICRMRASFGVGITVPVVIDIIPLTWKQAKQLTKFTVEITGNLGLLFFFGSRNGVEDWIMVCRR